jgi:hypothetical protein
MVHRQALVSRNMSEELQTVFQAVVRSAVSKTLRWEGDFLRSFDGMEAQHRRRYTAVKHIVCIVVK